MHIGVDLDNTILDATSAHLRYYNLASGLSFTPDDVNDFYLYRLYGWNKEEAESVYREYGHDIHWSSLPLRGAVEMLGALSQLHQISIITARPVHFRDVTVDWLKHYEIPYSRIVFTEDKLQECINSQVDVLIDDGPHYAMQFANQNRLVILMEQPYNLSVSHDLLLRATNWCEIKGYIDHLDGRMQVSVAGE